MTLAVIEFLENIIQAGTDNAVYFTMGLIATLIFVIRLALALFIGDSADGGDFDVDLDEAGHISGEAFEIFSLLSMFLEPWLLVPPSRSESKQGQRHGQDVPQPR